MIVQGSLSVIGPSVVRQVPRDRPLFSVFSTLKEGLLEMTLDLLGHVPQLTTKNKKRLDHRRSQTTPSPSSQHEIYRKLSLRKLEKVNIKKKKTKKKVITVAE